MSHKIYSATLAGLEGIPIEIESDVSQGLPSFVIVGLPDTAVQESRERIRAAIKNSSFPYPRTRVTINLAPADLKKEGSYFDLPIALSLLNTTLEKKILSLTSHDLVVGELALDGSVRRIRGALSFALLAREKGFSRIILPYDNIAEASLVPDITIIGVKSLADAFSYLQGNSTEGIKEIQGSGNSMIKNDRNEVKNDIDFATIKGQEHIKRALEIAAAGGHNIFMIGPPGSGKTLLARALSTILPPLTDEEVIELTRLHSAAGMLKDQSLVHTRPFRSPHHNSSIPALVGGGALAKPGEVSLAHRGVLFLDEVGEFHKNVLESLRQPVEEGTITIARARDTVCYPSRFILVLSQNPCPCGYYQDEFHECTCTIHSIQKYHKKVSGPLLDRIDMHLPVPPVALEKLHDTRRTESSADIRSRVIAARDTQRTRYGSDGFLSNAELSDSGIQKYISLTSEAEKLLREASQKLHLSARSYFRIIKLSQTIADLTQSNKITEEHIGEALQYRPQKFLDL